MCGPNISAHICSLISSRRNPGPAAAEDAAGREGRGGRPCPTPRLRGRAHLPFPASRFPLPASAPCLPEHTDPSTATRCHHAGPYDSRSPARKSQGWRLLTPWARAHASLLRPTCAVYTGCPPSALPRGCGCRGPWLAPLPPDGPEHGGPSGHMRRPNGRSAVPVK